MRSFSPNETSFFQEPQCSKFPLHHMFELQKKKGARRPLLRRRDWRSTAEGVVFHAGAHSTYYVPLLSSTREKKEKIS